MGTPGLARVSLERLAGSPEMDVVAVVTQPDRPKGRDLKLLPSPVKELAFRLNLPVLQPLRARDDAFLAELRRFEPDLIAVAAYGQILPKPLLDLPRFGCLNVHTSLLPRYRGAAPIQWAILNGDPETGVTIMKIDAGLDTGDVLARERTAIAPEDTAETLHDRLAQMGADLLARTIPAYVAGQIVPQPQSAQGVVYAAKIKKEDGRIDWTRPAVRLWNQVRGLTPWPGAFTTLPNASPPQLLKIWRVEVVEQAGPPGEILAADKAGVLVGCGEQALRILMLQREGGKRLGARDYLAGHPLAPGQRLG